MAETKAIINYAHKIWKTVDMSSDIDMQLIEDKDGIKGYCTKELDSIKREAIDIYGDHFDQKKSFFFESLEGDKNWSRYTIIGCSSGDYLEVFGNKIKKYSL